MASGRVGEIRGPWRLSGQWWESGAWAGEEWDVETERGETVRLVNRANQWSVEGLAD